MEGDYVIYLKILKSKKSNVLMLNASSEWSIEKMIHTIKDNVLRYMATIKNLENLSIDDLEVVEPISPMCVLKPQKQIIKDKYGDNKKRLVFYVNPIYKINKV